MSHAHKDTTPPAAQGTFKTYLLGLSLSLILTLIPFALVWMELLAGKNLLIAIIALALLQLIVQLHFFLHVDTEHKPRWNLLAFLFMLMVLVIIVAGSLWIMYNLNYRMM